MATVADYPTENCDLVTVAALTLQADNSSRHLYPGIMCLPGQRLLLVDFSLNNVRLYNRQTGDILAKSKELYPLWDICSIDENKSKLAVTLRNGKIQIMSIIANGPSPDIIPLKVLKTPLDSCRGVSSIPKQDKLVVCGMYRTMQCWCVLSISDESVGKRHDICENGGFGCSYVVASGSGKCVYISCFADKSADTGVYGYVMKTGELIFRYQREDLSWPRGICADKRGFIYVCNQHLDSRNIHQLTEKGELVMIFRLELPPDPQGMCLDQNQEQIFITLWGKNQISSLRLVWRGHAETAQSHEARVRTRDRRKPPAQDREILRSKRSSHDKEILTQIDKSASEEFTMGCFGCFRTRVSKNKNKAKEEYKTKLDKDEKRLVHRTWNDLEMTTPSDKDSQTSSLKIGDPSPHDVLIQAREPVLLDEDVTPGKPPELSGLKKNEATQESKNEIVETPKQRPHHRRKESSHSETDSESEDSSSSAASNDSAGIRTGHNSGKAIIGTNSGMVSIGASSKSKFVQINFVEKANKKKRRKKKSRSYDKETCQAHDVFGSDGSKRPAQGGESLTQKDMMTDITDPAGRIYLCASDLTKPNEFQASLQKRVLPPGKKYHVFFSYASLDIEWVRETVHTLETVYGFVCCEYERDNTPGTSLLQFVSDSMNKACKTVIIMTRNAFQSSFVVHEIQMALNQVLSKGETFVIPVLLEDCEIPDYLRVLHYIDARDSKRKDIWWPKLLMELDSPGI